MVHGKGSMLNKMPGDEWQRFITCGCSDLYMFTHPGKKLLFAGTEFGYKYEWNRWVATPSTGGCWMSISIGV